MKIGLSILLIIASALNTLWGMPGKDRRIDYDVEEGLSNKTFDKVDTFREDVKKLVDQYRIMKDALSDAHHINGLILFIAGVIILVDGLILFKKNKAAEHANFMRNMAKDKEA